MTTTTFTERVGLAERTKESYEKNHAALSAKLKADEWIDELDEVVARAKALDARQEALKAEQKATTAELNAVDRAMYRLTSGAIDAAVGALGKGSPEAVQLARMRAKLHRPDPPIEEVQPVEPSPT